VAQVTSPVLSPPFLLATDGSPSARLAQKLLCLIAQALQPEESSNGRTVIVVLIVQPRQSSRSNRLIKRIRRPLGPSPETNQQGTSNLEVDVVPPSDDQSLQTEDELKNLIHTNFSSDFPASVEIRRGRPATEILNYARTIRTGLIAVGSRGAGGVRELLLGSVSAVVARYAPCSVLVARSRTVEPPEEPTLKHVLLVVNEFQGTQQAIAMTRQLIPAGVQEITILCAQPPLNAEYLFGPFVTPTPSWQLNRSLQEARREQGEQLLQQAQRSLNLPSLTIQRLLQTGEPGSLICQVAQQQEVDLIILGSDANRRTLFGIAALGRSLSSSRESLLSPLQNIRKQKRAEGETVEQLPALRNTRLSITEDYTIHHAPCPVLLCRPPLSPKSSGWAD